MGCRCTRGRRGTVLRVTTVVGSTPRDMVTRREEKKRDKVWRLLWSRRIVFLGVEMVMERRYVTGEEERKTLTLAR